MSARTDAVTPATLLITLGVVFGDIGTSPIYVFTAITDGTDFDPTLVLGSMSCILWTLLLLATLKYVVLALNKDNQGEGGIFALYALLRRRGNKWIIFPALIGCATLISDGFLTPAISISSAVEGLNLRFPTLPTIPVVVVIVTALFLFQRSGTQVIGRIFGPVMLVWFGFLATLGVWHILDNPAVLAAANPWYAFQFLLHYPQALWVLGAVFLCTTGAEALYSDLGHFGKTNIRITWAFVLTALLLNYFGQAAYCLSLPAGARVESVFYDTVPPALLPFAIGIATLAAIIASQALITGIFTLVNEAIKLRLWTNLTVRYPAEHRGQVYIPFINFFLLAGCLGVIGIFRHSTNMESAYGLAIVIDMLMTSLLLSYIFILDKRRRSTGLLALVGVFVVIELAFFTSNLAKFVHGGWFSLLVAAVLFGLLYLHYRARLIRQRTADYTRVDRLLPVLEDVMVDAEIPFEATHLVYPARSSDPKLIDSTIAFSLFRPRPKRAQVYWFVHVDNTDQPWGINREITPILSGQCYHVTLRFGFKERHQLPLLIRDVVAELGKRGEISSESAYRSLKLHDFEPDFRFVVLNSRLEDTAQLSSLDRIAVTVYRLLKSTGLSSTEEYGLDKTNTTQEFVPIRSPRSRKPITIPS